MAERNFENLRPVSENWFPVNTKCQIFLSKLTASTWIGCSFASKLASKTGFSIHVDIQVDSVQILWFFVKIASTTSQQTSSNDANEFLWWFGISQTSVTSILNRSPTSQTCHQHLWSPTSVTNIDIILMTVLIGSIWFWNVPKCDLNVKIFYFW